MLRSTISRLAFRYASLLSIGLLLSASVPYPAFAQTSTPTPGVKLPVTTAANGPRKLAMMRGKANESAGGSAALNVQAGQRVLALMVTDQEGEELESPGLELTLKTPQGVAPADTPLPKFDPAAQGMYDQYRAKLVKEAGIAGEKNADVIADKLAAAANRVAMPAPLQSRMKALTSALGQTRNFTMRVRNPQTRRVEGILVLNPSPGLWKCEVKGKSNQDYFATLAAGDSLRAIGQDFRLWEDAVKKHVPVLQDEGPRGPAGWTGGVDPIAYASGVSCTVCKITVRALIVAGSFIVGGAALFVALSLGITAPLATLVIQLLFTFVPMALATGEIARKVCKAIKLCN